MHPFLWLLIYIIIYFVLNQSSSEHIAFLNSVDCSRKLTEPKEREGTVWGLWESIDQEALNVQLASQVGGSPVGLSPSPGESDTVSG